MVALVVEQRMSVFLDCRSRGFGRLDKTGQQDEQTGVFSDGMRVSFLVITDTGSESWVKCDAYTSWRALSEGYNGVQGHDRRFVLELDVWDRHCEGEIVVDTARRRSKDSGQSILRLFGWEVVCYTHCVDRAHDHSKMQLGVRFSTGDRESSPES
ncbi:hypothetical protein Tco_1313900 [Tanacetum coccineum]